MDISSLPTIQLHMQIKKKQTGFFDMDRNCVVKMITLITQCWAKGLIYFLSFY